MYHSRGRRSRGTVGAADKVWILIVVLAVSALVASIVAAGAMGVPVGW